MKNYLILLTLALIYSSCAIKHATTVTLENKGVDKISLILKANNCSVEFKDIAPHTKAEKMLDWTNITKADGSYEVIITQADGSTNDYSHGYFTNGELTNYIDMEANGTEVKINISE